MALSNETGGFTGTRYYLRPTEGQFDVKLRTSSDEYEPQEPAKSVTGKLESLMIVHDEGTPPSRGSKGYDPYDKLIVVLTDVESNEYYSISVNADRVFAWTFAAQLHAVDKGDVIKIRVRPGNNPAVTLCNVELFQDGEWVRIESEQFEGTSDEKAAQGRQTILAHPAYREPMERQER